MLSLLIPTLVLYGLWFLAGLWIVRVRVRSQWDPAFEQSVITPRAGSILSFLYQAAPVMAVVLVLAVTDPTVFHPAGGFYALATGAVLFCVPNAVAQWLHARHAARLERHFAQDSDPVHGKMSVRIYLQRSGIAPAILLLIIYGALNPPGSHGRLIGALIGGFIGTAARYRDRRHLFPVGKLPPSIELPDLPLRQEIQNLYRRPETPDDGHLPVIVQPGRLASDPFKLPLMYLERRGLQRWKRKRTIPMGTILHFDPSAYTAALARDLSFGRIGGYEGVRVHRLGCLFLTAVVCLGLLALIITSLVIMGRGPLGILVSVLLVISGVVLFCYGSRETQNTARETYREVFLNWHDADPEADRTVEEFVASLAQAEWVIECIRDPEVVLYRLRMDRGLRAFLDLCGPAVKQSALQAAREGLAEPVTMKAELLS